MLRSQGSYGVGRETLALLPILLLIHCQTSFAGSAMADNDSTRAKDRFILISLLIGDFQIYTDNELTKLSESISTEITARLLYFDSIYGKKRYTHLITIKLLERNRVYALPLSSSRDGGK